MIWLALYPLPKLPLYLQFSCRCSANELSAVVCLRLLCFDCGSIKEQRLCLTRWVIRLQRSGRGASLLSLIQLLVVTTPPLAPPTSSVLLSSASLIHRSKSQWQGSLLTLSSAPLSPVPPHITLASLGTSRVYPPITWPSFARPSTLFIARV